MSDKLIKVATGDEDDLTGSLQDVIDFLNSCLESVPDEFKELVEIDVEGTNDWGGACMEIKYRRPKTLDEINQEQEVERIRQKRVVESAKAHYLKVKQKYGEE